MNQISRETVSSTSRVELYGGARTFTVKFEAGNAVPKYTIDGHDGIDEERGGQRIIFVMDDGTELEVHNRGDHIEVECQRSQRTGTLPVAVCPISPSSVRVEPV